MIIQIHLRTIYSNSAHRRAPNTHIQTHISHNTNDLEASTFPKRVHL
nr:MAG TPA: hypothetical protein [Caudoviricetes sp.]